MISDTRIGGTTEAAVSTPILGWKRRGRNSVDVVSARKLAASLWRLADIAPAGGTVRWLCADRLGFQFCSSLPIPRFATEGATKWDFLESKAWECSDHFQGNEKSASALFKPRKHVNEGGWSRAKNKYSMNEERASSMRTEWRSAINRLAEGVKRERKFCKKMDRMNSNLLRDIAEAKLSARKLIRHLDKEKKAREQLEDRCYDLAKEIEGRRAEIGALKSEQRRVHEEVEEERRMQQMAEVWREEQAQMKLADAKIILEDRYEEVNEVIAHLRAFMRRSKDSKTSEAEWRNDGRCCSNDQADCASFVHFINNEFKDAGRRKMSWIEGQGEGEGSVRRSRKVHKGSHKSEGGSKIPSSSRLHNGSRANPHVVRAMTGHNQWPCRIQSHGVAGNLLEAKLESQKMLLRNVLKQRV